MTRAVSWAVSVGGGDGGFAGVARRSGGLTGGRDEAEHLGLSLGQPEACAGPVRRCGGARPNRTFEVNVATGVRFSRRDAESSARARPDVSGAVPLARRGAGPGPHGGTPRLWGLAPSPGA